MNTEKHKRFLVNFFYYTVIIICFYLSVKYVLPYIMPFAIGIMVALALQKPINYIHRTSRIPKKAVAMVLVVFIIGIISWLFILAAYYSIHGLSSLSEYLAGYVNNIPEAFNSLDDKILGFANGLPQGLADQFEKFYGSLAGSLTSILTSMANGLGKGFLNSVLNVPGYIVSVIVTLVSCCFFSMDYDSIVFFVKRQLSERQISIVTEAKSLFFSNILKMFRAYTLLLMLTFVELCIALPLLGVKYPVMVAALIAVVDILPILGVGTVLIPWTVICFATGNAPLGIGLIITYLIITFLRNFLEPKIVGQQVGLHPVVSLLALFLGVKLCGFWGLIVFPMTLIVLNQLQTSGKIKLWK